MWWRTDFRWLFVSILVLGLSACGYGLTANAPIALPQGMTDLNLNRVVDPTTEPWLEPRLRSILRDELTRRGRINWVDRDQAQGLMQVTILKYSDAGKLRSSTETTVKSEIRLDLEARIFDRTDRAQLWSSGTVSVVQSYQTGSDAARSEAGRKAVERAVEELADALGQKF